MMSWTSDVVGAVVSTVVFVASVLFIAWRLLVVTEVLLSAAGFAIVAAASAAMYALAKRRADRGLMPTTPPARFPAAVVTEPGMGVEVFEAVIGARDWWNTALGRVVFVDMSPGLTVTVSMAEVAGDYVARTSFSPGSEFVSVRVALDARLDVLIRSLCHELGHVLGLDHDLDPASVMFPRARIGGFELSDRDRDLLIRRLDES